MPEILIQSSDCILDLANRDVVGRIGVIIKYMHGHGYMPRPIRIEGVVVQCDLARGKRKAVLTQSCEIAGVIGDDLVLNDIVISTK